MTTEQREQLHDLYWAALKAWGRAERTGDYGNWQNAYAADKAFTEALFAIEVTA